MWYHDRKSISIRFQLEITESTIYFSHVRMNDQHAFMLQHTPNKISNNFRNLQIKRGTIPIHILQYPNNTNSYTHTKYYKGANIYVSVNLNPRKTFVCSRRAQTLQKCPLLRMSPKLSRFSRTWSSHKDSYYSMNRTFITLKLIHSAAVPAVYFSWLRLLIRFGRFFRKFCAYMRNSNFEEIILFLVAVLLLRWLLH